MDDAKGKATMLDLAHGQGSGQTASVAAQNLEPLITELIKAVRAISMVVNVPPAGAPDVCVAAPIVNVSTDELAGALREAQKTAADVVMVGNTGIMRLDVNVWIAVVIGLFAFDLVMVAIIAAKIIGGSGCFSIAS